MTRKIRVKDKPKFLFGAKDKLFLFVLIGVFLVSVVFYAILTFPTKPYYK